MRIKRPQAKYLPIESNQAQPTSTSMLRLQSHCKPLRKKSYVKIKEPFIVLRRVLRDYDSAKPDAEWILDESSLAMARKACKYVPPRPGSRVRSPRTEISSKKQGWQAEQKREAQTSPEITNESEMSKEAQISPEITNGSGMNQGDIQSKNTHRSKYEPRSWRTGQRGPPQKKGKRNARATRRAAAQKRAKSRRRARSMKEGSDGTVTMSVFQKVVGWICSGTRWLRAFSPLGNPFTRRRGRQRRRR